jgi:hypothetical protein
LGFRSLFGGSFGTGGRVDLWTEDIKRKARLHVATWNRTAGATHCFPLHKLDEHARYRFTDAYSMESSEMTGLEAMASGFAVTQEPMSSTVLAYAKYWSEYWCALFRVFHVSASSV